MIYGGLTERIDFFWKQVDQLILQIVTNQLLKTLLRGDTDLLPHFTLGIHDVPLAHTATALQK